MAEDVEHAGLVEHLAVLLGGEEAGDERIDADVLVGPFGARLRVRLCTAALESE